MTLWLHDEKEGEETLPWRFDVEAVGVECKFFLDLSLSFLLFYSTFIYRI